MVNYKSSALALLSVSSLKYARGMPTSKRQQSLEECDFSAATCVLMGAEVGSWGMVYSGQKVESWILYVLTGITTMSAIVDEINYYKSHMPLSVVGENSGLEIVSDTMVTLVMAVLTASANKVVSKTENAKTYSRAVLYRVCLIWVITVLILWRLICKRCSRTSAGISILVIALVCTNVTIILSLCT